MFTQDDMQTLLSFEGPGPVISLYLDTDGAKQPIETIKQQARGLLREVGNGLKADADQIEKFVLQEYDWSQPGLAVFSSSRGDFFHSYPVAVSFRNRIRTTHKPYVKPLAHLLDHYAHFGVVLVDQVGARFFHYHLGELQRQEGFMGEEIRKSKRGGGSSATGMRGGDSGGRHDAEWVQHNLRAAADAAVSFFARKAVRRLFLGGTAETVSQLRELLPKQWQSCVAGTFPIDMNANEPEIRERALTLLRQANEQREQKLVASMLAAQASGHNGVVGLDETLQAISEKRVQTLVISDGFRTPGYVHPESGFVVANLVKSPLSESELMAVTDVIDRAVAQTLAQGGHVEVISDNPDLARVGHIGAILRY
jgi:peptide subunit release factor 1 (eRF1)